MQIICVGQYLKEAVSVAERNVSKNQTLPVLHALYLNAKNNELQIRATNLETALEITIPCKVQIPGTLVVSAKTLGAFLSHIDDENILLQNQKNNLFIKTDKTNTTLRGYSPEEFPLFPHITSSATLTIPLKELQESLQRVVIACSTSPVKPELMSVLVRIFKNTMKLAATDSFRLAEKTIVSKTINTESLVSFLIPQQAVVELLRLLDRPSLTNSSLTQHVTVHYNKNQIIVQNPSMRFISRLTEGSFPDYEQIIPKSFKMEAIVKKSDFLNHIKLASVFVGRLNDLTNTFDPKKKVVRFEASHPDIGDHSADIDSTIQGESLSAKFNWRYLSDGVTQINSDYMVLGFNGEQTPLMIRGKGDPSYLYLTMPMRGI